MTRKTKGGAHSEFFFKNQLLLFIGKFFVNQCKLAHLEYERDSDEKRMKKKKEERERECEDLKSFFFTCKHCVEILCHESFFLIQLLQALRQVVRISLCGCLKALE